MDRGESRRYQSARGRAGVDVRRRPLSTSRGSSPRSKRSRHREPSESGPRVPVDTEAASTDDPVHPNPQGSMSNDDCVLVSPRSSRFLFAGPRDLPRTRRGNGSGRLGRERRWRASPIVVLDDDSDEDAVVVEESRAPPPLPPAGPSFARRRRSAIRTNPSRQQRPPSSLVDITLDSNRAPLRHVAMPQEGRRRQQERRPVAVPPLRRSAPRALSPLVPARRPTPLPLRSGSYPRHGGRAPSSHTVERQIAEDEQLARRLQEREREAGEQRATPHSIPDVLDLLDSSSDDDEDSDDTMFMLSYGFGMGRRGRSPGPPLFPVVSLLDNLHTPLLSQLAFLDSDSDDEDDYEHLVQLGEALGEVVPQGLTALQIAQLPTRRVVGSDLASDRRTCHICLEDFRRNNIVRTLPCLHEYHKGCLDKWLKRNSTCPLCRKEALE